MKTSLIFAFIISVIPQVISTKCSNVTEADAEVNCKKYISKGADTYDHFLEIDSLRFKRGYTANDTLLNLNLFVATESDAHIILSPTDTANFSSNNYYLIVLGSTNNRFANIRRGHVEIKSSVDFEGVLSPDALLPITIKIMSSGLISVTITGQSSPFIDLSEDNLLPIKYISFSSWHNVQAKWYYDCDSHTDEIRSWQNKLHSTVNELTLSQNKTDELMKELSEVKSTYETCLAEQVNKTIQMDKEIHSWLNKLNSTENELTSSRNKTDELVTELSEVKSTYGARLAEQINKTIQSDEEIRSWRSKLYSTENELTSSRNKTDELMKELSEVKSTYEARLAEQINKTIQMDEEIRSWKNKLNSTETELIKSRNETAQLLKEFGDLKSTYLTSLDEQLNKTIQMDEEIRSLQNKLNSTGNVVSSTATKISPKIDCIQELN